MSNPRAADDFVTIRARMDELRRERAAAPQAGETDAAQKPPSDRIESAVERRRRARIEGAPPPWVPTIFTRRPRH